MQGLHCHTPQLRACRCAPLGSIQSRSTASRRLNQWALRSAKAAELLAEANIRYRSGDRVTALNIYEEALQEPGLTVRQKQIALHGATCVHASFGEVEAAQAVLRQAFLAGLDWEDALEDPELVQPKTSLQISLQLKKFNQQLQQNAAALRTKSNSWSTVESAPESSLTDDIANMLGTSSSDTLELDASPLGIAKRAATVVGALVVLGAVLFYTGLALDPLDKSVNTEALDVYGGAAGESNAAAALDFPE